MTADVRRTDAVFILHKPVDIVTVVDDQPTSVIKESLSTGTLKICTNVSGSYRIHKRKLPIKKYSFMNFGLLCKQKIPFLTLPPFCCCCSTQLRIVLILAQVNLRSGYSLGRGSFLYVFANNFLL